MTDQMDTDASAAAAVLDAFARLVGGLADGQLHLADPEGGWTIAQVVSHTHLSGMLWIAVLQRSQRNPDLELWREELGHDAVGAAPPTVEQAVGRLRSVRTALVEALPTADPAVLEHSVTFEPFGRMTIGMLQPGIVGHLAAHAEQVRSILRARGIEPAA